MSEKENMKNNEKLKIGETGELTHKLAAVGWSLFFIWVGKVLLMKISHGAAYWESGSSP